MQNYYISRCGQKNYQRGHRPLLGDGIQEYAECVGVGIVIIIISALIPIGLLSFYYCVTRLPKDWKEKTDQKAGEPEGKADKK